MISVFINNYFQYYYESFCFQTLEQQSILCGHGIVAALGPLLLSDVYEVCIYVHIYHTNN